MLLWTLKHPPVFILPIKKKEKIKRAKTFSHCLKLLCAFKSMTTAFNREAFVWLRRHEWGMIMDNAMYLCMPAMESAQKKLSSLFFPKSEVFCFTMNAFKVKVAVMLHSLNAYAVKHFMCFISYNSEWKHVYVLRHRVFDHTPLCSFFQSYQTTLVIFMFWFTARETVSDIMKRLNWKRLEFAIMLMHICNLPVKPLLTCLDCNLKEI